MRIITVPDSFQIDGRPYNFKDFLTQTIDAYAPVGKSVKMLRQAAKIVDAVERSNGHVTLEDAEYEVLKAAMHFDDGQGEWNVKVGRLSLAFFDAVEKAEEVKK